MKRPKQQVRERGRETQEVNAKLNNKIHYDNKKEKRRQNTKLFSHSIPNSCSFRCKRSLK
jgi:hypothetical protein